MYKILLGENGSGKTLKLKSIFNEKLENNIGKTRYIFFDVEKIVSNKFRQYDYSNISEVANFNMQIGQNENAMVNYCLDITDIDHDMILNILKKNFSVSFENFTFNEVSTGMHYLLALISTCERANKFNDYVDMYIDEVDAHLSPLSQKELVSYLNGLEKFNYTISTHSANFVSCLTKQNATLSIIEGGKLVNKDEYIGTDVINIITDLQKISRVSTSEQNILDKMNDILMYDSNSSELKISELENIEKNDYIKREYQLEILACKNFINGDINV